MQTALTLSLLYCASLAWCQTPSMDAAARVKYAADSGRGTWAKVLTLDEGLSSRELYLYALALCEAGEHPERLNDLFALGARMQDRDEQSRGYGNFRWSWRDGSVRDFNAVEFCMQSATVLWLRHRDALPPDARQCLRETMEFAVQGCLRHRVPVSYTNIALMNAQCLILLGEGLERPEVADEGYGRLEAFVLYTWENGIHEYDSPTYYGVDLDDLALIETFCQRETGREQARALLKLLWTDIALNWWDRNQRLAGARSRDYDYLHGHGFLDTQLWTHGWLTGEPRGGSGVILPTLSTWRPDLGLWAYRKQPFPRVVRQKWGVGGMQARTHFMADDITLSCAGANYGPMDLPLTVDLPGASESPRGYFIPDGRRDPYGKKKIPAGPHEKTLHLKPFWSATQLRNDALGLVVYRPTDLPPGSATLESHFVLPREVEGFWIDDKPLQLTDTPQVFPLQFDQCLTLRAGTAAVGLRVPWARGLDGKPAQVALVDDGNEHGVVRLTVAHHSFWGLEDSTVAAAACFWVRVGSGLQTDAQFAAWRREFCSAASTADDSADRLHLEVAGTAGPLSLTTAPPFLGFIRAEPPHTRAVLELDGEDVGKALLASLPCIQAYEARPESPPAPAIAVTGTTTEWEAEAGVVTGSMVTGTDDLAFGSKYVWTPGAPGAIGARAEGAVTWKLKLTKEGVYYLWGRVLTPTPTDDSFFVRAVTDDTEIVSNAEWHTGTHTEWSWSAVSFDRTPLATKLFLPAGEVTLQLLTREDGAKIDRLLLTSDPNERPQ